MEIIFAAALAVTPPTVLFENRNPVTLGGGSGPVTVKLYSPNFTIKIKHTPYGYVLAE
mgnify:CR=1 FL=1